MSGHVEKCTAPIAKRRATRPDFVRVLLQDLLIPPMLVPARHVMVVEMWDTLRETAQKQLGKQPDECLPWELRKPVRTCAA